METPAAPPLGRAAGIAVRWNGAAAVVTLATQLGQIFILARILAPHDFGVAAAALAVTAFLAGLSDLGLTNALVHRESLTRTAWASAWWAALVAGTVVCLVALAASPAVESLLRLDGLASLLAVSLLSVPLFGAGSVFQAHLQRHLRLRRLAAVEIAASLAGFAAALGWASARGDAMALIAGQVVLALSRFAGLGLASSLRPKPRLRWDELKPLAGFGGYQLAERIVAHALGNLDRLLVARLLGPAAAGYYFMASQIALKPASLFGPFVSRTLLPLLARIRDDRARIAASYLRSLSLLSLAAACAYMFLFGLAGPLTRLVLGEGWEPAVPILRLLSLAGFLFVLGNALGSLTLALGKAGVGFWLSLLVLAARLVAIIAGARYGLTGVAAAVLFVTVLSLAIDYILPRRWLGIGAAALTRAAAWPLIPAAAAAAAMIVLSGRLALSGLAETLVVGVAGGLMFLGTARLLQKERLSAALRELAETVRARKT